MEEYIVVTHFINPHLFWYHKAQNSNHHKIEIIERELASEYADSACLPDYYPQEHDAVAVKYLAWAKYIRARVKSVAHIPTGDEYILWATDYGFPFRTQLEHVRPLSLQLQVSISHVRRGGMYGILPADRAMAEPFDEEWARAGVHDWSKFACDGVENLLSLAVAVTFNVNGCVNGHNWGDLKIATKNSRDSKYNINQELINMLAAVRVAENFYQICDSLSTTKIISWKSNSGEAKYKLNILPKANNCDDQSGGGTDFQTDEACGEFARRQIERCQRTSADIAFEELSYKADTTFAKGSENAGAQSATEQQRRLSANSTETIYMEPADQCMRLAGSMTKMKLDTYGERLLPAPPSVAAFGMDISEDNYEQTFKKTKTPRASASAPTSPPTNPSTLLMGNNISDPPTASGHSSYMSNLINKRNMVQSAEHTWSNVKAAGTLNPIQIDDMWRTSNVVDMPVENGLPSTDASENIDHQQLFDNRKKLTMMNEINDTSAIRKPTVTATQCQSQPTSTSVYMQQLLEKRKHMINQNNHQADMAIACTSTVESTKIRTASNSVKYLNQLLEKRKMITTQRDATRNSNLGSSSDSLYNNPLKTRERIINQSNDGSGRSEDCASIAGSEKSGPILSTSSYRKQLLEKRKKIISGSNDGSEMSMECLSIAGSEKSIPSVPSSVLSYRKQLLEQRTKVISTRNGAIRNTCDPRPPPSTERTENQSPYCDDLNSSKLLESRKKILSESNDRNERSIECSSVAGSEKSGPILSTSSYRQQLLEKRKKIIRESNDGSERSVDCASIAGSEKSGPILSTTSYRKHLLEKRKKIICANNAEIRNTFDPRQPSTDRSNNQSSSDGPNHNKITSESNDENEMPKECTSVMGSVENIPVPSTMTYRKQLLEKRKKIMIKNNDGCHDTSITCPSSTESEKAARTSSGVSYRENQLDTSKKKSNLINDQTRLSPLNMSLAMKNCDQAILENATVGCKSPFNDNISKFVETKAENEIMKLPMLPVGFDLTNLQTYNDEENHWHRKKTTRADSAPSFPQKKPRPLIDYTDKYNKSSEVVRSVGLKRNEADVQNDTKHLKGAGQGEDIRRDFCGNLINKFKLPGVDKDLTAYDWKQSERIREVDDEHRLNALIGDRLVMTHSTGPVYPIETLATAYFLQEVTDEMTRRNITKVFRIQSYAWSHLMRGNSLVIVNPSKTGRTWSYLPPLSCLLKLRTHRQPASYGPMAIILVASAAHAEVVSDLSVRLLANNGNESLTVVTSFGVKNLKETKMKLLSSCCILIATPPSLKRLLNFNEDESLIDPKRLNHLIIDDMDLMLSRSPDDFDMVLKALFKITRNAETNKLSMQLVAISCDWNARMLSMLHLSNQPLLCIGDFLEAAVYAKTPISITLQSSDEKIRVILQFIQDHPIASESLIIFCKNDSDVTAIVEILRHNGHICIGYNSKSGTREREVVLEWKRHFCRRKILVCTDTVFAELQIQNVHNVIHYGMPSTWTKFTRRFSAMNKLYTNYVNEDLKCEDGRPDERILPRSLILLDEESNHELPRLIEFMQRHNQQDRIHPDIMAVSKQMIRQREQSRMESGCLMCPYVMEFGDCDLARCNYRHTFSDSDRTTISDDIPTSGDIRVHILRVFSPTYYTARLLDHKPPNSTERKDLRQSSKMAAFSLQINMHHANQEHLVIQYPLSVGDVCIYYFLDTYQRVRIVKIDKMKEHAVENRQRVSVKLIDMGIVQDVMSDELYVCHKKFLGFPAQAIDIRLLGVVPYDNERSWDCSSTNAVRNWLIKEIAPADCVHVSISFALLDTLWVSNVVVMEKLPVVGRLIYRMNVKRSLIEHQYAVPSSSKRSICDLAEEAGMFQQLDAAQSEECLSKDSIEKDHMKNAEVTSADCVLINNESSADTDAIEVTEDIVSKSEMEGIWDEILDWQNTTDETKCTKESVAVDQGIKLVTRDTCGEEEWCKLPVHEMLKVELGDENHNGTWTKIYLHITEESYMKKFVELFIIVNKHIDKLKEATSIVDRIPDEWFQPMQNCIVKHDGLYLRAKLHSVFGHEPNNRIFKFFLCDYACFISRPESQLHSDFLYKTTQEIVTFTPYQAVHCTLAGILVDRLANNFTLTKDYLFALAIREQEADGNAIDGLKMRSFEILLYENESDVDLRSSQMVNRLLVEKCGAQLDPAEEGILNLYAEIPQRKEIALQPSTVDQPVSDKNIPEVGEVVSFNELLSCIQRSYELDSEAIENDEFTDETMEKIREANQICEIALEGNTNKGNLSPPAEIDSTPRDEEMSDGSKNDTSKACDTTVLSSDIGLPPLRALYKRPQTTWYQTDYLICFLIHAPDIASYYLEVSQNFLCFAATVNGEDVGLVLNFLGNVDPQYVSHEILGLNVVVRLVKDLFLTWPRLLQDPTKFSWLKYNYNAMDGRESDQVLPEYQWDVEGGNTRRNVVGYIDSDYDSDDNEKHLFATYTPIANREDTPDQSDEAIDS